MRFMKRRLMLLILKLAIFIGSDGSGRRYFSGKEACCFQSRAAHPQGSVQT